MHGAEGSRFTCVHMVCPTHTDLAYESSPRNSLKRLSPQHVYCSACFQAQQQHAQLLKWLHDILKPLSVLCTSFVLPLDSPWQEVLTRGVARAQVSSPIVVEGPDAGTGRGVPWEDSARELEGHGPGGKPSPADKSSQQHSKPGHHTLHHAPRNNTGRFAMLRACSNVP